MSRIEVPAWVAQSFVRSTMAVGATSSRTDIEEVCTKFLDLWSTPERHFHDTRHLFDLLTWIDRLASEAQNIDVIRLAAWGHGCVFNTRDQVVYTRNGGEDRAESARVSAELFRSLGIPDDVVDQVSYLITSMRKHPLPAPEAGVYEAEDMDLLVLVDAHLGFLANQPQKYRTYIAEVRAEYAHIPTRDFVEARLEVVAHLLQRKRLFSTPLAADWEEPARQNLESEHARLGAELAQMDADEEHAQPAPEYDRDVAERDEAAEPDDEARGEETDNENRDGEVADQESQEPAVEQGIAPSQANYGGSTLEVPADHLDPGAPSKVLTPEEARQARRDGVVRASREKIERARENAVSNNNADARDDYENELPSGLVE